MVSRERALAPSNRIPASRERIPPSRERILEAALAEFTAGGIAGASIEGIKRRSGASVGSIYHHFGGKIEIADALYLEGLADYQDGLVAELLRAGSAREGVRQAVHHHLHWVESNPQLARFLLLGSEVALTDAGRRRLRQRNRAFFARVEAWRDPLVQAGELRALPLPVMSALWIGPSQELARHWLAGRSGDSPIEAAPLLADAAWRSLCP